MKTYRGFGLWMIITGSIAATACGSTGEDSASTTTTCNGSGSCTGGQGTGGETTGGAGGATGGASTGGSGGATSKGGTGGTGGLCEPLTPTLVSPGAGATVEGGSVLLEWSQGDGPYQVEIAFDPEFTDPVSDPITTADQSVTVDGLNGGYFYWRVRGLGGCAASEPTPAAELHVTCKPIQLAADPATFLYAASIAWNAEDHEYGVTYTSKVMGIEKLMFLRVDRLGNTLFGPAEITGALMPAPSTGGYTSPSIVHVPSVDRWVVSYHREGEDQSYVTLFDDAGTVLATQPLDDGSDSETQSVSYDPTLDRIVTSTDHGGSVWNTHVQQFDASLNPVGQSVNASGCAAFPNGGNTNASVTLPGLSGVGPSVFAAFDYRETLSPNNVHDLFAQRVDLSSGALAWPVGGAGQCAGAQLDPSPANDRMYTADLAWNPDGQNVGVAYTVNPAQGGGVTANAYFRIIDPKTGAAIGQEIFLNAAAPDKALIGMPKVAWDGEEFLIMWDDGSDPVQFLHPRMTKVDSSGSVIGGGDVPFSQPGWANLVPSWSARSLVGHDRIHAFVYRHHDTDASPSQVWMCIEPSYP